MRGRLIFTLVAVAVVVGVVLWGLAPSGTRKQAEAGAGATPATASPSPQNSSPRPSSPQSRPSSPRPSAVSSGWRLTFNERFSGSRLNTAIWGTCYPWAGDTGCTNFQNHEYQWYLPSQDRVSGGVLHLVAQRLPTRGLNAQGAPKEYACRSGIVTTYPGFRFQYGYVQVVARLTSQTGMWPALWLAAANLKWPPEIDIVEHWGMWSGQTAVFLHPVGAGQLAKKLNQRNFSVGWHTFAVSWTPSRLVWIIDGRTVLTTGTRVPHQPMYFIANLAESRDLGANRGCDATLLIKSVKVWQQH